MRFSFRYYVTEIVDGEQKRVQRSERLCSKDAKYYAKNAKAVKLLRDEFMLTINQQAPGHVNVDTTIVEFWRGEDHAGSLRWPRAAPLVDVAFDALVAAAKNRVQKPDPARSPWRCGLGSA